MIAFYTTLPSSNLSCWYWCLFHWPTDLKYLFIVPKIASSTVTLCMLFLINYSGRVPCLSVWADTNDCHWHNW